MTTANAYVQTTTRPEMRGRVMALYMAIFVGGTPLGAPLVGWVADAFGPRWALGLAAVSGILAAAVVLFWMVRYRRLRVQVHPFSAPRVRVVHAGDGREAPPARPSRRGGTAVLERAEAPEEPDSDGDGDLSPDLERAAERNRETATREIAIVEATVPR
jgi:MFS family permease